MHWRRKWQPTPVFLPGESQEWEAWWAAVYGVTESDTTEVTQQQQQQQIPLVIHPGLVSPCSLLSASYFFLVDQDLSCGRFLLIGLNQW